MGRIADVETGDQISPELANRVLADYVSQTDTGTQAIGGIVYIGRRTSDPSTAGWGEAEKGYLWFNLTEGKYKYWNGAAIVAFPSAGGAGAPVDASYVTINAEADLTGEIQHANIVDEAQKHTPKIHTHVEADITDLDHDALKIKGKTVDDSGIGADKYLKYDGANVAYGTLPAGSTYKLAPSYTIYKVGATYYAMDADGDTSINGANAATVINAAVAALPGTDHEGIIFLKRGTYSLASALTIGKATRLIGEGKIFTKLDVTGNVNGVEISSLDNPAIYEISNLYIDMNGHDGSAIYSTHAGHNGHEGQPVIHNVKISNIASGYCGFDLTDPFMLTIRNIEIRSNSGTGIYYKVDNSEGVHYGNGFVEQVYVGINGENAVGLHIESGATYVQNLIEFHRIQVGGTGTSLSGTKGIWIEGSRYLAFYNLDLEGARTQILIDDSYNIDLYAAMVWASGGSGYYGVRLTGTTRNVNFWGGLIEVSGGGVIYSDESTGGLANTLNSVNGVRLNWGTITLGNTRLHDCTINNDKYSENAGTETLLNGQTALVFNHGLYTTAQHVRIGWKEDIGGKSWHWTSSATQITLTISAAAGEDYDFEWTASIS